MFSRRENFLATLRKEPHDYMPAAFVIDNMNYPGSLPKNVFDVGRCFEIEHSVQFQRRLGLDVLFRVSPGGIRETATGDFWQNDSAGGRICQTPVGILHSDAPATPGAPMLELGREVLLKSPDDYDTLAWLFERHRYEIDEPSIAECQRHLNLIGGDGILYVNSPASAIMDAVRSWAGIQGFVFTLYDFPEKVENLLTIVMERYCEQYELICRTTPAEVLVFWDDATTSLLSREMFLKYSLPNLKRYADICHRYNKILVNHTCGKIRGFVDLYAEAEQDAIDWLAVPPAGDMSLSLAKEMWRGKVTPVVTPDPGVIRYGSPDEVLSHFIDMLDGVDTSEIIVLLPCPQGTPIEYSETNRFPCSFLMIWQTVSKMTLNHKRIKTAKNSLGGIS
jgi:hypothetical protein